MENPFSKTIVDNNSQVVQYLIDYCLQNMTRGNSVIIRNSDKSAWNS